MVLLMACGTAAPAGRETVAAPRGAPGPVSTAAPAAEAAPTAPPAPVRVRLAFTAISGAQLPIWVAQDAGIFLQNGVDADLSYIATSQTAMGALLGNEVDILSGGAEAALAVAVEGGDAVAVGAKLNKVVQAMYAAPSITEPGQLRGKTVGVTRLGSLSGTSARYLLRSWGLEPERDVTLLQTGGFPETVAALSVSGIDAGMLPPPQTLRAQDAGFVELANLWSTSFDYPGSIISMLRPRTPEQEELTRRTLRAVVEAIHRIKTDRATALRSLQGGTKTDDPRALEEGYEIYAPLYERDLRLSREAFRNALEELAHTNPRAASTSPDNLIDSRFVDEIRQSGLIERLYGSQ